MHLEFQTEREVGILGHTVQCACGQRNDLAVFSFGEEKLCLACGRPLPQLEHHYLAEQFEPEVEVDAFVAGDLAEATSDHPLSGFESPSQEQLSPCVAPTPSAPQSRVWNDGIREVTTNVDGEHCSCCGRTFRGDWDRNLRDTGEVCHLCATKADNSYQVPSPSERRTLHRSEPPKKLMVNEVAKESEWARKKKGLTILAVAGTLTVLVVVLLPVEHWIATLFILDTSQATELPRHWLVIVRILDFGVRSFGQGLALYATLALMNLLYEDKRENIVPLVVLGISFALINGVVAWLISVVGVFGPVAGILVVMAFFVAIATQFLMISSRFPLRLEGGFSFILTWSLVSLALGPCMNMVGKLLGGIVAALVM